MDMITVTAKTVDEAAYLHCKSNVKGCSDRDP